MKRNELPSAPTGDGAADAQRIGSILSQRTRDLSERVKELNCLYAISSLMLVDGLSLAEIAQGALAAIPPAWQYPQDTCARIVIEGAAYATGNYVETPWQQAAVLRLDGEAVGSVTVGYLVARPISDEGPFLVDERRLVNAVAELLTQAVRTGRAQSRLRASEARFRGVVEAAPLAILSLDTEGNVVSWSPGAELIFGWAGDEVTGGPDPTVPHGRRHEARLLAQHALAGGSLMEVETQRRTKHGGLKDVSYSTAALLDGEGSVVGSVVVMADLTERKQVEDALRQSRDQLSLLSRSMADMAVFRFRLRPEPRFEFVSPSVVSLTGYSAEDFHADPDLLLSRTWEGDRPAVAAVMSAPQSHREPLSFRWLRRDGSTVWFEQRLAPVAGPVAAPEVIEGVLRDVTSHRRVEGALKQAQQRQEALLQTAPMAVFRRRAAAGYETLWASDAVEALTGYQATRFTQESGFWLSRVYPGDREGVLLEQRRACRHGSAVYEYRWRVAGDTYRRFVERASLIAAEGDREPELLVTVADVSDARQRSGGSGRRSWPVLRGQGAPTAGNWRRVVVEFPETALAPLDRPEACPHCGSQILRRHQTTARPLAGHPTPVQVTRYRCTACGRTFSNYPAGVGRGRQTGAVRLLVGLLAAMGLSAEATLSVLAQAGIGLSRTTAWRLAAQARPAGLPPAPASVRCVLAREDTPSEGEFVVIEGIAQAADATPPGPLAVELLIWERGGAFYAWLREAVASLGAVLAGSD